MLRLRSLRRILSSLVGILVICTVAVAQDPPNFVYTNDDVAGPNTISAFSVIERGALVAVAGSPFLTGGTGFGDWFYAAPRLAISGKFLYASNAVSSNVSGFVINTASGVLTPVPGSPFATGGTGNSISVAATPNGAFLMAGHSGSNNVAVFSVNQITGALTPIDGSPFPAGGVVNGMKVTPDGKFLAVVLPASNAVGMLSIAMNGTLAPIFGSPFLARMPAGVEINCKSNLAFVGKGSIAGSAVHVFNLSIAGTLTPIPGSPFNPGVGMNSSVPMLDPTDKLLFVSNQLSDSITVFNVAANGTPTVVSGSPFKVFGNGNPTSMAVTRNGRFLYVVNRNNLVGALSVSSTGALTPVSGSPFITGNTSAIAQTVAVYPPKRCRVD